MGRTSKSGSEGLSKKSFTVHKHLRDPVARSLLLLSGDRKPKTTENFGIINIEMAWGFSLPFSFSGIFFEPGSHN